jgi:hypothetical protein
MPLTKSFNELMQNRAANDPEFAAAGRRETIDTPPLTMREALHEIWEADRYPIFGNEDWRTSAAFTKEALARAATATASRDDPPEFGRWLAALQDRSLHNADRQAIMTALYDLFDPEDSLGG